MTKLTRIGKTTGRWPQYNLIVDGVDIGRIKRGLTSGGDRMAPHVREDAWHIHGIACDSQKSAEYELIRRAIRFGYLPDSLGAEVGD